MYTFSYHTRLNSYHSKRLYNTMQSAIKACKRLMEKDLEITFCEVEEIENNHTVIIKLIYRQFN